MVEIGDQTTSTQRERRKKKAKDDVKARRQRLEDTESEGSDPFAITKKMKKQTEGIDKYLLEELEGGPKAKKKADLKKGG